MNALIVCPEQRDIIGYTHTIVIEPFDFLVYDQNIINCSQGMKAGLVRTQAPHLRDVSNVRTVEHVRQDLALIGDNLF